MWIASIETAVKALRQSPARLDERVHAGEWRILIGEPWLPGRANPQPHTTSLRCRPPEEAVRFFSLTAFFPTA